MQCKLPHAVLFFVLCLAVVVPLGSAQYDATGLFEFSKCWQQPADQNNSIFNLEADDRIDEKDLLRLLDGWQSGLPTATPVVTDTPPPTYTPTPTDTFAPTPSMTYTITPTSTMIPTDTPEPTFTFTPTPSSTPTAPSTLTSTPTHTTTPSSTFTPAPPNPLIIDLPGGVTMEMVLIPAGTFQMGSNDDSSWSWCHPCEQPVHTVNIGYDFYMGKYEVTEAQWYALMGPNPSSSDYPVTDISWDNCQWFIGQLNALGQGAFRLPSEAEWEYACRAETTTRFSFGDSNCSPSICSAYDLAEYGWYCGNNSPSDRKPVGWLLPNDFGLYDMHGNVLEWCQDHWHESYSGNPPTDGSAWESPTSSERVLRGGNWWSYPMWCRSSSRTKTSQGTRYGGAHGLRLVRELDM